ncbi:sodium/potassium-transporting ATPase subunit beta-like [Limulus polyphemus]|uniref:Sodium/potassium-transporting ATPase subunit beta-like n=1 Tax=Limulus polyphemus TaxID=6850 RepID=A0ABM1SPS3_LIMPO|nr:sodium/potassium-transporting ATPase subunit beta-like [Limulus polyphemus]XP_022245629.1 sodium/potassium-transporting ATPase subunit beta-like [Limulus polyphemus]XP_022245637.1 sodium/potassium-transporting ATPase subunit beta-like [Limulus polyphemus]XP_022245641.1 sodium/potassium-transporting ATPase subunit beta-like [Limulus polyphemus]XP_022245645.1 sodium/potassium-transporting ATPase subunit beta-like [Limulus polyphemus]
MSKNALVRGYNSTSAFGATKKETRTKGLHSRCVRKGRISILGAVMLTSIIITIPQCYGVIIRCNNSTMKVIPRLMKVFPTTEGSLNLIHYKLGRVPLGGKNWTEMTQQLSQLLSGYNTRQMNYQNITECSEESPPAGHSCFFNIQLISSECTEAKTFGYRRSEPCIFLQFPNISNWEPVPYNISDPQTVNELPERLRSTYDPRYAYINCEGDTAFDRENLGFINYSPYQGFPVNFFPYTGQPNYMPPLVAVHFPTLRIGVAVNVVCKLWAKNVNHTEDAVPNGTVRFTLLVD